LEQQREMRFARVELEQFTSQSECQHWGTGRRGYGVTPSAEYTGLAGRQNTQRGPLPVSSDANVGRGNIMKRHGNLWKRIIDLDNITRAYKKARKAKTWQRTIKEFEKNTEENLKRIHRQLKEQTFTTSEYRIKKVYEPKERDIYILPFDPDRIVQHALVNVLGPIWDNLMIKDSYACRPGKGQHRASHAVMQAVRNRKYCFQADIRKFYPSIRHDLLMDVLARKIKDKDVLWLMEDIIYSIPGGRNVPIGNFTSQWFGNLYLNELDMFVKHALKIKNYVRYNDDFCLFHDSKQYLKECRERIRQFVADHLDLSVSKEKLYPVSSGVDFVGYRHFPDKILLRKRTAKRIKKKIAEKVHLYRTKQLSRERFESSLQAVKGWIVWAQSYNYRLSLRLDSLIEEVRCA
jgi:hypothetical protein